ncbi:MAG: glycosyltransferase family 4 protein [Hyphomicrobiaceae bacterium]
MGGLFRHVCDLSLEQARRGHGVSVVCDAATADALTEDRLERLAPHLALGLLRVPMSRELGLRDVTALRAVTERALKFDFDVVHGHGAKGGAYSRLAARAMRRAGEPVVSCYTPHGGSLHYHPSTATGRIYMGLERQLARYTDAIVFESSYAAARYSAQVGAPACATSVIPNGLAPEEFAQAEPAPGAADFLFVGELRHLKGVDVLLRALAQVRARRMVSAVIVGAGPDAAKYTREAAKNGLDGVARFIGPMPAREAFRLGRTLVVPSRAESLPYIVLEAAAAGLPLLASDVGGIPEIVAGTDTDLLPPGDADALAHAMMGVLDNPVAARSRAERLRETVAERFTIEAMTDGVLDLYAQVRASLAQR